MREKSPKSQTQTANSPPIPQTLPPAHETQQAKTLRLHLYRDVEPLRDGVRAERHRAQGPQEHHGGREAPGGFGPVVAQDLGHELDAPEDGADGAEGGGGGGDGGLRVHIVFVLVFWGALVVGG